MSFVSAEFLLFFCIVIPLYFLTPHRMHWAYLLAASYLFYAYWNAGYLFLIVFSTLVDYWAARWLDETDRSQVARRRLLLAASIVVNLGVLFTFKYFNFFADSLVGGLNALGIQANPVLLQVLLPVGISFYTFQSMSYTIDVYRGHIKPERHFGIFATFIAFFPQLVAGPIERAGNMLPQFRQRVGLDYDRIVGGLRLILWGIFKKVVVADHIAIYVNNVYNNVESYSGLPLMLATLFFAFQIYCDFSAYSDIAIGTARIMGFRLMDNFRQPYLSLSVREFWRRWHISLSTWFRDYLYIPLGGSRVRFSRNLFNLLVVFVVSGLWHGANWTFIIWGALHGIFLVVEILISRALPVGGLQFPGVRYLRWALTFALVCFAWIFFRANSLDDARYVVTALFDFSGGFSTLAIPYYEVVMSATNELALALFLIAFVMFVDWLDSRWGVIETWGSRPWPLRWGVYYGLTTAVLLVLLVYGASTSDFIYFQF